jgi:pyruvate dehydrogenase E2 component (dihydrolipoamide acetyltransferase)
MLSIDHSVIFKEAYMPKFLLMPKIGMNMTEGVITRWLISPGDRVEKEQVILESETDKAIQEIVATESGIVQKLLVEEGDVVPCQTKIAILFDENEKYSVPSELESPDRVLQKEQDQLETPEAQTKTFIAKGAYQPSIERKKISPLAKKTALELGININEVLPKKEGLRITKPDVIRYFQNKKTVNPTISPEGDVSKESNLEKSILTFQNTVDVEELCSYLRDLSSKYSITMSSMLVKICAFALMNNNKINVICKKGVVQLINDINIGIAIATENGFHTLVIRNADKKGILEIEQEIIYSIENNQPNCRLEDNFSDGTFTIVNLEKLEIESLNSIIFRDQCAVLGVGRIKKTPIICNDELVVRQCMQFSFSFDCKAIEEMAAAKYFKELKSYIEYPLYPLFMSA